MIRLIRLVASIACILLGAVVGATLTHVFVAPVIALAAAVVAASMLLFRYG